MPVPLDDVYVHNADVPSGSTEAEECADCGATVASGSSMASAVSETAATPTVITRVCVVDDCPFRGLDGADLWTHVSANHRDHALVVEHVSHAVRVPYEGYWATNVKRFLINCPFGVYMVTLSLQWEPCSLMCSVDAHDSVWTAWEVICHDDDDVAMAQLWARAFDYHEVDSVYYQLKSDKGYWPSIYLRLLLE